MSFAEEVRLFHTTGTFTTSPDLATGVVDRLRRIAAADLSPWVKLGEAVFRAHEVRDDGKSIHINASVHNLAVLAGLEGLRPGSWGGLKDVRLTYRGVSVPVRVRSVTTSATASRATDVGIVVDKDLAQAPPMSMSISLSGKTYTAGVVTELLLREALFGERAPRSLLSLGGGVGDPLRQLPREPVAGDVLAAVLTLLLTEALVSSGRASRVATVRVGPRGPDGHHLMVEWWPRDSDGSDSTNLVVAGVWRPQN
jgi:hypothetical protein